MSSTDAPIERLPRAEEQPTLDVPVAGKLLFDLGRSASYQAAARGDLPTIRVGGRLRVPTAALRRLVGLEP